MIAYFIGQGRPVEVKEGGKISFKLGHFGPSEVACDQRSKLR